MPLVIISKLSEPDNIGDDIVAHCKKRIERLKTLKKHADESTHDAYDRCIAANEKKIQRIRFFNSQCF